MLGQLLQRVVPGHGLKLTRAARPAALERVPQAVGMIDRLQPGLAAGTELAEVDGVLGVPFELFCQPHLDYTLLPVANHFRVAFHDADQQAASGGTERAHTWLP